MADLAGSKRPASTPFASPSKAASKRSRTKYDYGSDDDTESSPEDQWSAEDADSISWLSEDDNARTFMPSSYADFMSTSSDDGNGDEIEHKLCCHQSLTGSEVGRQISALSAVVHNFLKSNRSL